MNRDFTINVTEDKQSRLLEYLNDMQKGVDKNRNNDNSDAFLSAMHYRDGFLRALAILGIDYDLGEYKTEDGSRGLEFDRLKKDVFKN
jgi:hypothetical protein